MILITGATGHLGGHTIDFLLQKGIKPNDISVLVRSAEKAEDLKSKGIHIKIGDYDDYNSLVDAFKGVNKLLLISASDVMKRGEQHRNAVMAAQEASVRHIFYTSFERKDRTNDSNKKGPSPLALIEQAHIDTESLIQESGMVYTIFRNNFYMDMVPTMYIGESIPEKGLFLPAGDNKSAFALRKDMAEAIANVLLDGRSHENKVYSLSNSEKVSFQDIAEFLSEITNTKITYTNATVEDYEEALIKAGMPKEYIGFQTSFAEAFKQGEFNTNTKDLENLLGRKPTTIKTFLHDFYA